MMRYSFVIEANGIIDRRAPEQEFMTWLNISIKQLSMSLLILLGLTVGSILIAKQISLTPPNLDTLPASGVDSNSAVLWANVYSLGSASSVKLSFEWGNERDKYSGETLVNTADKPGPYSFKWTNLEPGKTYFYRAKAIGDKTAYGRVQQFNISVYQAPQIVTLDAENSPIAASLKGNLSSLGSSSYVLTSFIWWTDPSYTYETGPQKSDNIGIFTARLTDLKPNITYFYKAKAQGDRETVIGDVKSFITSTKPPSITTNAGAATAFSALLGASVSSMGTASSVSVSFEYGIDSSNLDKKTAGEEMDSTGSFSFRILNLNPGTTYYFRAKAVGDGITYGDIKQVRTTIGNVSPYQ